MQLSQGRYCYGFSQLALRRELLYSNTNSDFQPFNEVKFVRIYNLQEFFFIYLLSKLLVILKKKKKRAELAGRKSQVEQKAQWIGELMLRFGHQNFILNDKRVWMMIHHTRHHQSVSFITVLKQNHRSDLSFSLGLDSLVKDVNISYYHCKICVLPETLT